MIFISDIKFLCYITLCLIYSIITKFHDTFYSIKTVINSSMIILQAKQLDDSYKPLNQTY